VDDFLPIVLLLVLGLLFAGLSFLASGLLAPKRRPTAAKVAPYECGILPAVEPPTRFPVRFYLIAMIFIIFDIEIVFLYPWAVIYHQLRSFGLVEVLVFAAVVFISFLSLISNGALSWGPAKRLDSAMPPRTSDSTINRISAGTGGPGGPARTVASPSDPRSPAISDPDAPTTGDPAPVPTGPGRAA
jgi:NADH-quinone oxidoreductase subunit A